MRKITAEELVGKGNVGRPDIPGVSTAEMQRILDELSREVIIPAFNALSDEAQTALDARYTKTETDQKINEKVVAIGSGDMAQAVYDPTGKRKDVFAAINTAISEALATTMLRATYDPQEKNTDVFAYTDEKVEQLTSANAGAHNAIYRGKFLGNRVTEEQYAAISDGTFYDLFIGDYWTIYSVNYRIAAFDYYLNTGDTACTSHHVVIVPDTCLYDADMNSTDTTKGGYVGSAMYTSNLNRAKNIINNAFNGHVLSHRLYLTNAVSNGYASGCVWRDSEADLMCEQMVYGSGIFSPVSNGSDAPVNYRVEKTQLPLFQHEPSRIANNENWWLRDVITNNIFADVYKTGSADKSNASNSYGVRPTFCIY